MLSGDSNNCIPIPRLDGKCVSVVALDINVHLEPLWDAQNKYKEELNTKEDLVWKYMPLGPFNNIQEFKEFLTGPLFQPIYPYVIQYKEKESAPPRIVGFTTYMDIHPQFRSCEIGHLWLDPRFRGMGLMDQAIYLMLQHAFDVAKYRRVQWTCDSRNVVSQKIALRNKFQLEGIQRCKIIMKGESVDVPYLSITHFEWENGVKDYFKNKFD